VLRAAHAGARLVVVPHPAVPARADAFWIVGGRIADWGPLPADADELAARTDTALAAAPARSLGGWLPADELDETRIVGMWVAGHDEARVLELDPPPDARALAAISASPTDDRPRRARRAAPSARAREPALGS
jgi:DNA polymerase III subunit epsilon